MPFVSQCKFPYLSVFRIRDQQCRALGSPKAWSARNGRQLDLSLCSDTGLLFNSFHSSLLLFLHRPSPFLLFLLPSCLPAPSLCCFLPVSLPFSLFPSCSSSLSHISTLLDDSLFSSPSHKLHTAKDTKAVCGLVRESPETSRV